MPTIKQRYTQLTKRIWNPQVYNYKKNFKAAVRRSQNLGLFTNQSFSIQDMEFSISDKEQIVGLILEAVYDVGKFQLEDLAHKCFIVSNYLQKFLYQNLEINSVVTTGNLYNNRLQINYEPLKSLKRRLKDSLYTPIFKGHAWLTLENMDVIDLSIVPNMWLEGISLGELELRENYQKIVWTDTKHEDRKSLVYEPLIIGFEYFEKIRLPINVYTFPKHQTSTT